VATASRQPNPAKCVQGFRYGELTEIVRQESDRPFAEMLRRFRTGAITPEDREILERCEVSEAEALKFIAEPETVYLASLNSNVDAANMVACNKLKGENEQIISLQAADSYRLRDPLEGPSVAAWLLAHRDAPDFTGGVRGEIKVGCFILSCSLFSCHM